MTRDPSDLNATMEIRFATPDHATELNHLIRELAQFERSLDAVVCTASTLEQQLSASVPPFRCYLGFLGNTCIGFALFHDNYSTWKARKGVWLEDLFIRPAYRGRGYGSALFEAVLHHARSVQAGRVDWQVLNWNTQAHRFYERYGASPMDQWSTWRIEL